MSVRDFRKAGHPPTPLSAFLYFPLRAGWMKDSGDIAEAYASTA